MVAGGCRGDFGDTGAQGDEPTRQLGAACIDGGFVIGWRLQRDQRPCGGEQPVLLRLTKGGEMLSVNHGASSIIIFE